MKQYNSINKAVRKKDATQLLLGKPSFVDDVTPQDCLMIKLLRSPHAHALIESIDTTVASKVPGIEAIYTYQDVPQKRFTTAGQTYPEPSPYDRLILDKRLRYVGDVVAIIAGENEAAIDKAMKLIKVTYEVLDAVLDFHTAKDNEVLVHPEDDWTPLCEVGADQHKNLVATSSETHGDIDAVFESCDEVFERTYHTRAAQQAMMETFRTYCEIDTYGRLHVISSTQIVFHARRILANALDIPKSMIRVEKPRIGGGFGAKQTVIAELYPAFVTWKTKKPSKIIYTRKESQIASTPRHEMEVTVKVGAMKDGTIRALDVYTLSNSGAYSDHGPTTVGLSGHKTIPLYNTNLEAFKFHYDVVYTNLQTAGAFRGYGATQGVFAVESIVSELANKLGMDEVEIREKNMVREGQTLAAYYNEKTNSCTLNECMDHAKEMFDWKERSKVRKISEHKVRCAGVAMSMQGSGISSVDVGSATLKLNDDGFYVLNVGAADMGTGSDTILAQIAAECLSCDVDNVIVFSADTDTSPYDSGSYASSTTYVTGKAVEKAASELLDNLHLIASTELNCKKDDIIFDGSTFKFEDKFISLEDIATKSMVNNNITTQVTNTHSSEVSPPPYMVGMAEVEVDLQTGQVDVIDYVAVVDCGTTINTNLAKVQVEGGIAQGIGMALFENVQYTSKGAILESSFMQYKIPTRLDFGTLRVDFKNSYENTGPFGAKSIGEIVINTPSPAIANAIYKATGKWVRDLPMTPEKVLFAINE